MKRAKVLAESFVVNCGGCGEGISCPDGGSKFWTVWEIPSDKFAVDCDECGERNRVHVPQRMQRLGD